jgi:hypothetical protein
LKRLDRWLDQEVVKELDIDWIDEPYRKAVWQMAHYSADDFL